MHDNTVYGVVGGLGTFAGLDVVRRLNQRVSQYHSQSASEIRYPVDSDFPEVMYYQIPFQGVMPTGDLKAGEEVESVLNIEKGLSQAAKYFDYMGVNKTLFACNTYSKIASTILEDNGNVSLHDVFDDIMENAEGKTLLLASAKTAKDLSASGYYKESLIFLDADKQKIIDDIIDGSISRGPDYISENRLVQLIEDVLGKDYTGASNILIACTELSLFYHHLVHYYEMESILADHSFPIVYDTVEKAIDVMTSLKEIDNGKVVRI